MKEDRKRIKIDPIKLEIAKSSTKRIQFSLEKPLTPRKIFQRFIKIKQENHTIYLIN
jgi:hypothetical protein